MKKLIATILTIATLVILFNVAGNLVKSEIEDATSKARATSSYVEKEGK